MAVLYSANTLRFVRMCYVMWFIIPLYEFDVALYGFSSALCDFIVTLCELEIPFCVFIITLCGFICLCRFNITLIYLLHFVHFLIPSVDISSRYVTMADATYVGKARLRHMTNLYVM